MPVVVGKIATRESLPLRSCVAPKVALVGWIGPRNAFGPPSGSIVRKETPMRVSEQSMRMVKVHHAKHNQPLYFGTEL